jgi:DNA-binding NarL/FixJ family response regulator
MPGNDDLEALARALPRGDEPLSAALEQLPLPIWVADRGGRIRWLNVAGRALFGPQTGLHFSRYVAPDEVADARELFARKIAGRLDSTVHRTTLSTPSGEVAAEMTSVPLRADGAVIGVISLIRTDRRHGAAAPRLPKPRLTMRQQQVLELLAHGYSTAQIAATLQIAEDTTRNHIRLLLNELRVRSRLEAVVVAFRNDWL